MLFSLDSYNYFGRESGVIDRIVRFVKPGGKAVISIPGLKRPASSEDMKIFGLSWTPEQMDYILPIERWRQLFGESELATLDGLFEMDCHRRAWEDWLACDDEYARGDRAACEAGALDMMNTIGAVLVRK